MSYEQPKIFLSSGGDYFTCATGGTVKISGTLTTTGAVTVAGTLTVTGTETVSGTLAVSGTENVSGTQNITSAGTLAIAAGGKFYQSLQSMTTASTGKMNPSGITVIKSTKTAKVITMDTVTVGMRKTIYCTAASATGCITVKFGTGSSRTFDGSNWRLVFKKAGTFAEYILGSTARWLEMSRSVADGTALTSTST